MPKGTFMHKYFILLLFSLLSAFPAACRLDFAAERFEPFATPPRRYDVVAFRREPERRGASDARCGPCDQSLFFHPNNVNMFDVEVDAGTWGQIIRR